MVVLGITIHKKNKQVKKINQNIKSKSSVTKNKLKSHLWVF
ncbi:hypothetical protein HPSA20_0208 [Helicobacter pylori SouthAfrica20]|uniref:Uncharacterized protein n=1 Tax=Helicobacter pylori SouthAfrica20 TaxID=1352356 RepID=T1U7X5_HELPX|nr:hypothetical protein HPSA20_0208 [Helicobacter pylori SouthAfrica20]